MPPSLTLAVLARDEEHSLPAAIESARAWADEIVVRDTGSRDGTVETALGLGARVLRGSWHDDFSEARNLLLEAASCDWVLMLDADERLEQGGENLPELIAARGVAAWAVEIVSPVGFGRLEQTNAARLFRRAPGIHFEHRAHEHLEGAGAAGTAPLRILHQGWMPSQRCIKSRRNLALIERELAEQPGDPYVLWQRGRELNVIGHDEQARESLEAMADALRSCDGMALARLEWAPEAVADWAEELDQRGEGRRALGLATRVALAHPVRPLARFVHARALFAAGRPDDAACAASGLLRDREHWRCTAAEEPAILSQHAAALLASLGR